MYANLHTHLLTHVGLALSSHFHKNWRLVTTWWKHCPCVWVLCGETEKPISTLSCSLPAVNSWRRKATTQLTIVIKLPKSFLILAILNHTGPQDTKHISSVVTDLLAFEKLFLCVQTAMIWCCSSKCNKGRSTYLRLTLSFGRGGLVSRGRILPTCSWSLSKSILLVQAFLMSVVWCLFLR